MKKKDKRKTRARVTEKSDIPVMPIPEIGSGKKASPQIQKTIDDKQNPLVKKTKADDFLEEFLRNGGNATQAALVVFNCSSVESAASIGSQYLKKVKNLARIHLEKEGYGYGKMLNVAAEKMEKSKNTEWWDRLMKMAGYDDFITPQKPQKSGPISVNVFNAHKDLASDYVIDGEVETADDLMKAPETNDN